MQCSVCGQNNSPKARFCSKCGNTLGAAAQPLSEIGVGSSYGNGWRALWKHFLVLFLIIIISMLISAPSSIMNGIGQETGGAAGAAFGFLSMAYTFLLMNPVGYGVSFVFLRAVREDPLDVKDIFAAFKDYWNAVLAGLLVTLIIVIGLILFIVPGIIFACRLAFTPYLVIDRKMPAVDAVKESWHMTKGYAWKVFLIGLLAIPVAIAGLLVFGVGIIIAIMWISLAFASLYHAVSTSGKAPFPINARG